MYYACVISHNTHTRARARSLPPPILHYCNFDQIKSSFKSEFSQSRAGNKSRKKKKRRKSRRSSEKETIVENLRNKVASAPACECVNGEWYSEYRNPMYCYMCVNSDAISWNANLCRWFFWREFGSGLCDAIVYRLSGPRWIRQITVIYEHLLSMTRAVLSQTRKSDVSDGRGYWQSRVRSQNRKYHQRFANSRRSFVATRSPLRYIYARHTRILILYIRDMY